MLTERLRLLYVEVAAANLDRESTRTDSRISLATGIHRKEIRRLREAGGGAPVPALTEPSSVALSSALVARWLATAGVGAAEDDWVLPRVAAEGPSFDALVRSVTTDVRPRAVLDEWLAQGIVTVEAGDRVRLNTLAFVPAPGAEAQLFYFGRNLHDHVAAAAANVAAAEHAPFADLSVHYDHLSAPAARTLDQVAREAAGTFLKDINHRAAAIAAEDDKSQDPDRTRRVNFGIYLYVEDEAAPEAER
jgi:hypothetical protein